MPKTFPLVWLSKQRMQVSSKFTTNNFFPAASHCSKRLNNCQAASAYETKNFCTASHALLQPLKPRGKEPAALAQILKHRFGMFKSVPEHRNARQDQKRPQEISTDCVHHAVQESEANPRHTQRAQNGERKRKIRNDIGHTFVCISTSPISPTGTTRPMRACQRLRNLLAHARALLLGLPVQVWRFITFPSRIPFRCASANNCAVVGATP